LRNLYKFGPTGEAEFLLSTSSFAELIMRWDFLVRIARQDREMLVRMEDLKEEVSANAQQLSATITQVERNINQSERERTRLAALHSERQETVAQIRNQRSAYEAAAVELEKSART